MTTAQKAQTHTLPISPFSTLGPEVCGLLKDTREESLEQITRLEIQVNYYWWGLNKDADVVLGFYEAFTSLFMQEMGSVKNIVIILSAWQYKYYNSHFARCSVSFEKTLHNKHKFNLKKWWLKQLYIIIVLDNQDIFSSSLFYSGLLCSV